MKIVAFLQNQWWHDPEGVKKRIADHADPEVFRLRLISYGLSICTTGKRLEKYLLPAIEPETFKEIHWENSSREIGGRSASSFPADPKHMREVLNVQQPNVVLCFGKIARKGMDNLIVAPKIAVLYAVHPASRGSLDTLKHMARDLKILIEDRRRSNANSRR